MSYEVKNSIALDGLKMLTISWATTVHIGLRSKVSKMHKGNKLLRFQVSADGRPFSLNLLQVVSANCL